jgi:hypothetical protein
MSAAAQSALNVLVNPRFCDRSNSTLAIALLLCVCPGTPDTRYSFWMGNTVVAACLFRGLMTRLRADPPVCSMYPVIGIRVTVGLTSDCACDMMRFYKVLVPFL